VLNAIPATAGAVNSTYIATGAVGSTQIADANVTPAKLSTGAPSWDSAGVFSFNSGYGSVATAYGCRAWVNFNGTGTVAIRASGNVSSITDNGVGDYTVNFTTALPDANYAKGGVAHEDAPGGLATCPIWSTNQATNNCRIHTGITSNTSGGFSHVDYQQVQFFAFR
jgi:hypothetical protein